MKKQVSYFYEHDNKIVKDSFVSNKPYKPFPQVRDVQVLVVRLIPCIKKDPNLI